MPQRSRGWRPRPRHVQPLAGGGRIGDGLRPARIGGPCRRQRRSSRGCGRGWSSRACRLVGTKGCHDHHHVIGDLARDGEPGTGMRLVRRHRACVGDGRPDRLGRGRVDDGASSWSRTVAHQDRGRPHRRPTRLSTEGQEVAATRQLDRAGIRTGRVRRVEESDGLFDPDRPSIGDIGVRLGIDPCRWRQPVLEPIEPGPERLDRFAVRRIAVQPTTCARTPSEVDKAAVGPCRHRVTRPPSLDGRAVAPSHKAGHGASYLLDPIGRQAPDRHRSERQVRGRPGLDHRSIVVDSLEGEVAGGIVRDGPNHKPSPGVEEREVAAIDADDRCLWRDGRRSVRLEPSRRRRISLLAQREPAGRQSHGRSADQQEGRRQQDPGTARGRAADTTPQRLDGGPLALTPWLRSLRPPPGGSRRVRHRAGRR